MSERCPEQLPEGGTGRASAGLAEGMLRDWTTNGAVLLSLVMGVAGFVEGGMPWMVLAPVVSVAGIALSFATITRQWPAHRAWLVVLVVLLVDAGLLAAIWAR